MSNGTHPSGAEIADLFALKVQEFHRAGKLGAGQSLLKIDNRERAAQAPFQFDVVAGRLHRRGCAAIPKRSMSALYGFWDIERADQELACARCKPVASEEKQKEPELVSDLLYGLLSIVVQFGGVLRERGQEYRGSFAGRILGARIGGLYRGLDDAERKALDAIAASLTELASTLHNVEQGLHGADNGTGNGAANGRGNGTARGGKNGTGNSARSAGNGAGNASKGAKNGNGMKQGAGNGTDGPHAAATERKPKRKNRKAGRTPPRQN